MWKRLHVKYPLFLSDFNETWTLSIDVRRKFKYQISSKSVQREPSCSMRTDGQTDMKLIIAFRNFAKAPNKMQDGLDKLWKSRSYEQISCSRGARLMWLPTPISRWYSLHVNGSLSLKSFQLPPALFSNYTRMSPTRNFLHMFCLLFICRSLTMLSASDRNMFKWYQTDKGLKGSNSSLNRQSI
jgi:hypothetical protein